MDGGECARYCASREERVMTARGILGASLEKVVLQWALKDPLNN